MKKVRKEHIWKVLPLLIACIALGAFITSCNISPGGKSDDPTPDPENQWPFFRGSVRGTGSKNPVDTSATMDNVGWSVSFSDGYSYDENFISGVAIGNDGSIYVASSEIDSLDGVELSKISSSGSILWQYPASDPGAQINGTIHGSPVIGSDGNVYAGATDGFLYAISSAGTELWRFDLGATTFAPAAIGSDGTIYIGTSDVSAGADNAFYALNPDGTQKWNFPVNAIIRASANFAADGTIYVRVYDGSLYALNPNGTEKWLFEENVGGSGASPVIAPDGTIYIGDWESYTNGTLYAVNPNGTEKWNYEVSGGIGATPIVGSDGTVYVATWGRRVHAISPEGTTIWTTDEFANPIQSAPALGSDGKLYVGTLAEAMLYALNSETGEEVWSFELNSDPANYAITAPLVIGDDGSVYVHCGDGNLYAVK